MAGMGMEDMVDEEGMEGEVEGDVVVGLEAEAEDSEGDGNYEMTRRSRVDFRRSGINHRLYCIMYGIQGNHSFNWLSDT